MKKLAVLTAFFACSLSAANLSGELKHDIEFMRTLTCEAAGEIYLESYDYMMPLIDKARNVALRHSFSGVVNKDVLKLLLAERQMFFDAAKNEGEPTVWVAGRYYEDNCR